MCHDPAVCDLKTCFSRLFRCLIGIGIIFASPFALARADTLLEGLSESYRFLVSERDADGGALYTAAAGALKGRALPLSYLDSAAYWAEFVCAAPDVVCAVTDRYNPEDSTLSPLPGAGGPLQIERVFVHNGANIYDGAVWQIAVVLGQAANGFTNPHAVDAYDLAGNQSLLLGEGHCGDAEVVVKGANRAVTRGESFRYNGQAVSDPQNAFAFRMFGRAWLSDDPFRGTPWERWITVEGLPTRQTGQTPGYRRGRISWADWKPITGENAWAFLLGPLHAAYLHHVRYKGGRFVPFDEPAIRQALALLPTFAVMQSDIGAVYYAPAGTAGNVGGTFVHPQQVSVENNFSLYAGLKVLRATLEATSAGQTTLGGRDKRAIRQALVTIQTMLHGGKSASGRTTTGLIDFFRHRAWHAGGFVQGGLANAADRTEAWVPIPSPRAVDVNTWGVAALGAGMIDDWFGNGAAFDNWQQVKRWAGYGVGQTLWGVGYSDRDGNGKTDGGNYRQGIMSAEWTAGAITVVRNLRRHYARAAADGDPKAQARLTSLARDEQDMLDALVRLRHDRYASEAFPGRPDRYGRLIRTRSQPYLYASRRAMIPFGWYANPIPSTCATGWVVLVANHYDPFGYAGHPN